MNTKLRVVDPKQEHPLEIAKRKIREYRQPSHPVTNQHVEESIRPKGHLDVDEVLRASLPDHIGKTI